MCYRGLLFLSLSLEVMCNNARHSPVIAGLVILITVLNGCRINDNNRCCGYNCRRHHHGAFNLSPSAWWSLLVITSIRNLIITHPHSHYYQYWNRHQIQLLHLGFGVAAPGYGSQGLFCLCFLCRIWLTMVSDHWRLQEWELLVCFILAIKWLLSLVLSVSFTTCPINTDKK